MNKTLNRLLLCCGLAVMMLAGCAKNSHTVDDLQSEADLPGHSLLYISGTCYDIMYAHRTDLKAHGFNSQTDAIAALLNGHGDVFVVDESAIPPEERKRLGMKLAFRGEQEFRSAMTFRKEPSGLRDSLSYFIDSLITTGEMQEMNERWFETDSPSRVAMPDLSPEPQGKPIHVGIIIDVPPIAFPVGSRWRGMEPELMEKFARYVGRPVAFTYYPPSAGIAALQSGNIDVLGGDIFITEERQKTMSFATSHHTGHPGFFVKDNTEGERVGFFDGMKRMVKDNLIVEDRWRYVTDGLWETVKISVLAILLGSLLGGGVCWMRLSRRRWVSTTAKVYVDLMRGIPMLVLLMIMFYVVLAGTGMSATAVAVVAFALNFAAYVSEMFRTAIQSVGKGQTEAGLAIGFTRWQTFRYIVAPQALQAVMPVYKGEAVSLVKNTSIVGYVAIQDLTRASDMIRTRTFDAFFPLLIVTIIYFLLAWLLGKALDLIVKKPAKK